MKKVSKLFAVLLSVCLLVSLLAIPASAAAYQQPRVSVGKFETRPLIDGKLNEECWQYATEVPLSKARLAAGEGFFWPQDVGQSEDYSSFPEADGEGNAYFGWDEDYFYFGLVYHDDKNTNNEALTDDLWKGDCVQFQIGASVLAERYEIAFALSSFGGNRPLGRQWYPLAADFTVTGTTQMTASTSDNVLFYVTRDNKTKTTTQEIAIKLSYFGAKAGAVGNKIPFAYAVHLYGYGFLEWADGVVGNLTTKDLTIAAIMTFAAKNSSKNSLGGGTTPSSSAGKTTTTSKPATTTTKTPGSTTTAGGGNKVTTTTAGGNKVTTTVGGGNKVTTTVGGGKVTTTAAPTTTTAPEVEGTEFYNVENAVDVDNADVLAALGANFEGIEIAAKTYTVEKEKKLGVFESETLKGVYVKDGDKFVALEGTEETYENADGTSSKWLVYPVKAGDVVYVVEEVLPTTTPAPETTTEAAAAETTKAPTTQAADTDADNDKGGNGWIVWVIVAVAVVAVAVVAVVLLKKKGNGTDGDDNNTEGDNTDGTDGNENADTPTEE